MKKPKRKLAAIVFTDIVGFTKMSASLDAVMVVVRLNKLYKPPPEVYMLL